MRNDCLSLGILVKSQRGIDFDVHSFCIPSVVGYDPSCAEADAATGGQFVFARAVIWETMQT